MENRIVNRFLKRISRQQKRNLLQIKKNRKANKKLNKQNKLPVNKHRIANEKKKKKQ